ncbi:hypothetical protein [Paenibacillus harenae]|uniref:hypothetical protein n=1 Tax=Paenibacillus harenae TaxID=306543 RepID=UPI0027920A55|nr:hypothetical protein [Paenibacillus harenae]MDQ0062478.1 hypothetical protein [Paenibacillus harenae]
MKKYMIICFCLIIVIAATSILVLTNHSNDKSIEYKTDIEPLVSRFPNIGEINDSYWAADTYGGDFGPTSYWMKGYIYPTVGGMEKFKKSFTWHLTPDWNPAFESKISSGDIQQWAYSEEFNSYIKSSHFVGEFHMDLRNGVLYFDV